MERILSFFVLVAHASNEVPDGRVFGLDIQTAIGIAIQIVNIIILFAVIKKLVYKPVLNILKARKEKIAQDFDQAQTREEKAQGLIDQYEEKMAEVEEERKTILAQARQEAQEEKDKIIAKAEAEARKIKDDANKAIETERKLLQRNTRDYVLELSTLLTEQTLKDSVDGKIQADKLEESLDQLEVASWHN